MAMGHRRALPLPWCGSWHPRGDFISGGGDPAKNVKADFLFDESGSPIVDEINSISCAEAGNPTYSQSIGAPYASMTPGIAYDSTADSHNILTPQSVLDIGGTDHIVIEWGVVKTTGANPDYHWSFLAGSGNEDYGILAFASSTTVLRIFLKSEDGTSLSNDFTVTAASSTPRLYQLYIERGGNMELFEDGVSKGTASVTTLDSKIFTNEGLRLGTQFNGGGESLDGTMFRWRISIGTDVLDNDLLAA